MKCYLNIINKKIYDSDELYDYLYDKYLFEKNQGKLNFPKDIESLLEKIDSSLYNVGFIELTDEILQEIINFIKPSTKKIPLSICKNLMNSISALALYTGITDISEIEEYTKDIFFDIIEKLKKENNEENDENWEVIPD